MKGFFIDYERLRGAIGRRQEEIAHVLGIHRTSLSRKIHGKHKLTLDEMNKIAYFLGRDACDFIIETEMDRDGNRVG